NATPATSTILPSNTRSAKSTTPTKEAKKSPPKKALATNDILDSIHRQMKLWHAYLDGWRVLVRAFAFAFSLCLFSLPFIVTVLLVMRIENFSLRTTLATFGCLVCLPVSTYLASWYTGEF